MARLRRICALIAIQHILADVAVALALFVYVLAFVKGTTLAKRRIRARRYTINSRVPEQVRHLSRLVAFNDITCLRNLRVDRNTFGRLCYLLEHSRGLTDTKFITIPEQVAIFLSIISHHKKNCVVKHDFLRSGRTVSKHFHSVLSVVIMLHNILIARPLPITEDSTDTRWKWFKGCLGALDGTFIDVRVAEQDKGRYRTRKGHIAVNVLGVCNPNMQFIYVLTGWEGSAADSRVLRDAVTRPNGLRIPNGHYYLCDNGYSNADGFLIPYQGVRYHLREWDRGTAGPQNKEELFNLRHSSARNVIERTFGLLKVRWGILRSPSFYPITIQNRIILACCLLHNFIRSEMPNDPIEHEISDFPSVNVGDNGLDVVSTIEPNPAWSYWREELATSMYIEWQQRGTQH